MQRFFSVSGRVPRAACLAVCWSAWLALGAAGAWAQAKPNQAEMERFQRLEASIQWQSQGVGKLGTVGEIKIPQGCRFTGQQGAAAYAELTQNIPNPSELGVLENDAGGWCMVFSYDDSGHVPDDEKGKLDAEAILAALRAGNDQANIERRRRGWSELTLAGWITPPAYDAETHHLVWALRCHTNEGDSANQNTRILGRTGVMSAILVCSPERMDAVLPTAKKALADFQFTSGNKYAEWRAGDKVAAYGLTGLITGGAVLGAAKLGLLAKLGTFIAKFAKVIIVGVLALGAGIWKLLTGRRRQAE